MAPKKRLSRESPRLSPMTQSWPGPTVTGPNVLVSDAGRQVGLEQVLRR